MRLNTSFLPRSLVLGSIAALAAGPALAQSPPLLVSTESDVLASAGVPFVDDASLMRVEPGAPPRAIRSEGHWLAAAGFVPGDVDAVAFRPGIAPSDHRALAFSLLSNEQGVLDGDVLALKVGGGVEVVLAEASFTAALGLPAANVDIDALAFDGLGRVLFSLEADLAGTVLGQVRDGDVLQMEVSGAVSLVLSEADVQASVLAATGLSGAITDVSAIEWQASAVWVSVISPTGVDGGVVACGAAPAVVADEASLGLGGAELDALAALPAAADGFGLALEPWQSTPGGVVSGVVSGGVVGDPVFLVMAGNGGYVGGWPFGGVGAWYVDPLDPWMLAAHAAGVVVVFPLGAGGASQAAFALPSSVVGGVGLGGEAGWTFQAVDLVTLELAAPFRVKL